VPKHKLKAATCCAGSLMVPERSRRASTSLSHLTTNGIRGYCLQPSSWLLFGNVFKIASVRETTPLIGQQQGWITIHPKGSINVNATTVATNSIRGVLRHPDSAKQRLILLPIAQTAPPFPYLPTPAHNPHLPIQAAPTYTLYSSHLRR
jgi:hypothetical protein